MRAEFESADLLRLHIETKRLMSRLLEVREGP